MEQLELCGYCGHKPTISVYFSLRDQTLAYHIECPYCHHDEVVSSLKMRQSENGTIYFLAFFI